MVSKKGLLLFAITCAALAYVFSNPVLFGYCQNTYVTSKYTGCFDELPELMSILLFSLSLSLLLPTLLTYKMREEVFQIWWKFARWFVPLIIILTFLIENADMSGGGWAGLYSGTEYLFLGLFYVIFIIVSLMKITIGYLQGRKMQPQKYNPGEVPQALPVLLKKMFKGKR